MDHLTQRRMALTAQTAIRLATTGKGEVQQDFAEVRKAGTDAMTAIADASEAAGERTVTAAERSAQRQIDTWKRQAAAAKVAAVSGANQEAFNGALSRGGSQQPATVNFDRSTGGAREAASAFQEMFAQEDAAAAATAKLRAAIDPLYVAQARYDAELKVWALAASTGEISEEQHAEAVRLSSRALADARKELEGHSNALGLNRMQFVVGASAAHRFVDSILAGQSPMRAFMMQAGDVVTVLQSDDGGVAGGLAKVRALINPVTIGVGILTAAFVAGSAAGLSYANAMDKLTALSQGAGRVIGATGEQLEANAEAAARAGNISVASAREIETGYVQMGGIGSDVLAGLTALTGQFAAATGQDGKAALQQLGSAFQDPAKGADELAQRYGVLTQAQVDHIHELVEQNDLYGAQRALLHDLEPAFDGAADHANFFARAWRAIKNEASDAWTAMGKAIDVAAGGGAIADRIASLQAQRASLLGSNAGAGAISGIDRQLADLRAQLQRERAANDNAGARSRAVGAMATVDGITGDNDVGKLRSQLGQVRSLLADGGKAAGLTAEQVGRAKTAYADLSHAVSTYIPEGEKQVRIAQLDAQAAATKDPAKKAEIARQKELVQQSGKLVSSTQAVALATAAGDKARSEATKGGDKHAATLAREAAAQTASARAALDVANAYLQSGEAGAEAETRRKALTDATKKGTDVEAQVRRELAISVGEAAISGAKSVSQLRQETAARMDVNRQVASGAIDVGQMSGALSDEVALRDLTVKRALAYKLGLTDAYEAITGTIRAYKQALTEAHAEEAHGQALQSLDTLRQRVEDARLQAQYAGDTSGEYERERARRAANREADARRYSANDRRDVVAGSVSAADAELAARRSSTAAEALRSQRDSLALAQVEIGLVGKSAEEHDRVVSAFQLSRSLAHDLGDSYAQFAPDILAAADAAQRENQRLKLVQDTMSELQDAGSRFVDDLTNPDGSGLKSLLKDVEAELIKLAAINPLKNLLTGGNAPTLSSAMGIFGKLFGGGAAGSALNLGTGADATLTSTANADALFASLPHFAAGSNYTSGGMAWVGENGPEVVRLPRGASVTNASDTRRMLSAANDGGSRVVHNHFSGNLLTPEFWAQIQSGDDGAAMRGAAGGAQMANQGARRARRRLLAR